MDIINIDDIRVETMTLNELTALFRRIGIATSETKLADGIEQGRYPFGICIRSSKSGERQFEIYKRQVIEYITARSRMKEGAAS